LPQESGKTATLFASKAGILAFATKRRGLPQGAEA